MLKALMFNELEKERKTILYFLQKKILFYFAFKPPLPLIRASKVNPEIP